MKEEQNLLVKRVPSKLMEKLRKQADKEQRTIKMVVIRALWKYLDESNSQERR